MISINITKDFSKSPWPRLRENWEHSWEAFYEDILSKKFLELQWDEKLEIIFDGADWYPVSFISEAFWRLYKNQGGDKIFDKIIVVSKEDLLLEDLILRLAKDYNG